MKNVTAAFDRLSCEDAAPETTRLSVAEALVDRAEVMACTYLLSAGGLAEVASSPRSAYALEVAIEFACKDEKAAADALADAVLAIDLDDEDHPLTMRYREARATYHEAQAEALNALRTRLAG